MIRGEGNVLVLDPDELGPDPVAGMDLAVVLGVLWVEIRSAEGCNVLMLGDDRVRRIRKLAEERGLKVAALASPLWKWCRPGATPGRVDSFGFPTRVEVADRMGWVERAIEVAGILGTENVRMFSHVRVGSLTDDLASDPLLPRALDLAASAGVRLLLENEPVCTVARADRLLAVLERFCDRGLGLWLDIGNLHEVGDASPSVVRTLAPHVQYVHVKDFRYDSNGARIFCPAGTGCVPYPELLSVLGRARPGLVYALETHVRSAPVDALTQGMAFLRATLVGGAA